MANNNYYFSHEGNARNDEKVLCLRAEHGWEGYGLYWALVEMMFEQKESCLSHNRLPGIAIGLSCDQQTLEKVVKTCIDVGLFKTDEERFWSDSLIRRKQKLEEILRKRSEGGKKGMASRWSEEKKDNSVISDLKESNNSDISELKESNNSDITPNNKERKERKERKDGSKRGSSKKEEQPADTTVVREYFVERYKELIGCEPMISYGKDMKNLKEMIDTYGVKAMKQAIELYLKDNDRLAVENSHSLSFLRTKIGKYMAELSRGGGKKEAQYMSVDDLRNKQRKGEAL